MPYEPLTLHQKALRQGELLGQSP
ncbi:hypothetical protein D018_2174A, partial [Vibrio parahaemolyticus VP2007-007]